jgi:hypothetical protein
MKMNILFSALSIVIMAGILIASIYLRRKNRSRQRVLEIGFMHDGRECLLVVRLLRIAWFNFVTMNFVPERLAAMGLPISSTLHKKDSRVDINFKFDDMPAARAFVKGLARQGFSPEQIQQNRNKVLIEWTIPPCNA